MLHVGRGKHASAEILVVSGFNDANQFLVDVDGSIQMAGVAATPGPRVMYEDRAKSTGAIHGARMAGDNVP